MLALERLSPRDDLSADKSRGKSGSGRQGFSFDGRAVIVASRTAGRSEAITEANNRAEFKKQGGQERHD